MVNTGEIKNLIARAGSAARTRSDELAQRKLSAARQRDHEDAMLRREAVDAAGEIFRWADSAPILELRRAMAEAGLKELLLVTPSIRLTPTTGELSAGSFVKYLGERRWLVDTADKLVDHAGAAHVLDLAKTIREDLILIVIEQNLRTELAGP